MELCFEDVDRKIVYYVVYSHLYLYEICGSTTTCMMAHNPP